VYTLPSELRDIAYQSKRVVYDLLMKAAAETTLAIAADRKRLGARIGVTAVMPPCGGPTAFSGRSTRTLMRRRDGAVRRSALDLSRCLRHDHFTPGKQTCRLAS
jgi:hypothetical protein